MPMIQRCSNRMGNEMMRIHNRPHLGVDYEVAARLVERGWIVRKEVVGTLWTYSLTPAGEVAFERWKSNRIENIKVWSRKTPVFYEQDDCSHRAGMVTVEGDIVDLEPEIVREMIDNGLLEYEDEADSWVAPVATDPVALRLGNRFRRAEGTGHTGAHDRAREVAL